MRNTPSNCRWSGRTGKKEEISYLRAVFSPLILVCPMVAHTVTYMVHETTFLPLENLSSFLSRLTLAVVLCPCHTVILTSYQACESLCYSPALVECTGRVMEF